MIRQKYVSAALLPTCLLIAVLSLASSDKARLYVPEGDIIFSHRFHVTEVEVECAACHPDIESSVSSADKNLPTMDVCGECHDIEDDGNCGMCHRNPDDPSGLLNPERPISFNHQRHLTEGANCTLCHGSVATTETLTEANMPRMAVCMNCHDNIRAKADCVLCHENKLILTDLHPPDWRHQHADQAALDPDYCRSCHKKESYCVDCHRGDNLSGLTHELNFRFTHGLQAKSKEIDCSRCHDTQAFCNDCHISERRMPLEHSTVGWRTQHGRAAVTDIENCAVCHDADDPTCARVACHADRDGVLGTDPVIHARDVGRFDSHGDWHEDDQYFCFQCHQSTGRAGVGFCGYCHD